MKPLQAQGQKKIRKRQEEHLLFCCKEKEDSTHSLILVGTRNIVRIHLCVHLCIFYPWLSL